MARALVVVVMLGCGARTQPAPPSQPIAEPAPPIDAAPAEPLPLDQDLPSLARRALQLFEQLDQALAASGQDCAIATAKIRELVTAYGDVIAANGKVVREGRQAQLKQALAPYDAQMDAAARSIAGSPALASCVQNAEFTAAFDALVPPRS
ncbi:MAG: hypothetical protein AB7P03_23630 [Kofleriaceae bacterium]